MQYGCYDVNNNQTGPGCGDEGCTDPPRPWNPNTTSCEQIETPIYYRCEPGMGVCKDTPVTCATVQSYAGGVCTDGECPKMYPIGPKKVFQAVGCIGATPKPVE